MFRLTKTGLVFALVCLVFFVASGSSQSSLLLAPVGIFLGCGFVNIFGARRVVKNVNVHSPSSAHLAEGEKMSQPWKLANSSQAAVGSISLSARKDTLLKLARLDGKASASIVPNLVFSKRGVYSIADVELKSSFPFGLFESSRRLKLPGEIVVYPAVYPTDHPRAAGYDVMVGGKFHGKRRTTSGTNFAGIRPMEPSDPLKQIHWKSSAKGLGLMVKTFEEELSGRVSIIMDSGESGDEKIFDDCVRASASLIFAALDTGDHVEWIDLAERELVLIPPFSDGEEILERLARIEGKSGSITVENLEKVIHRVSHRSAICLVLTEMNEAVRKTIQDLRNQHRRVSVYLPDGCEVELADVEMFFYSANEIREREEAK
jgi:uncharacterized protein (DUF58 family)